ncbi:TonB-dependent siderophore receptor [Sphingobium cupriresistens]|uniref:TonB-denpendent receptor n=1 Tax=Sphingobium cupriresistens LL01 TaxID=1420583 RepID=A0A0J7Y268_9SPHN|nr:TonB-dependent siderophore receptor [Sphingobium cupriresistens]KMS57513.1 TonB-denpendent receptor [Sphingobium cupriresistens LL01]
MIRRYSLFLTASLAGVAVMPATAQAQVAADAAPPEEQIIVTGAYTLPDKIDTATGLGLTVRETPQSVTILTAQRIIDQNLVTAADVLRNGVGISVNNLDDLRNQFYARGFEIRNFQYDGIPLAWTLAGGAGETSTDVSVYERVEIVRGATGLLTGAGDPSASINFVRKHADATDLTGYVNASYGSWDRWRVSGDVSTPITADGRIRARVVGRYEQGDSYIDRFSDKRIILYGVVDADLTDNTLVRAGISHQDTNRDSPSWGNLPTFYADGTLTDWSRSKSTTGDWTYWNTINQNIFATIRQEIGEHWTVTANYNRLKNAEKAQLLYLSGAVDKATGTIQYAFPYKDHGESIQNAYDVQVKGSVNLFGRDHEVVLGGMKSIQKRFTDSFSALAFPAGPNFVAETGSAYENPGFSTTAFRAVEEKITQSGVYGAVRLNLADQFKLIGGGRLATWRQKGLSYGVTSDYGDKNVFIPYVGALFDVTPSHRLYASYTRIFQPQSALDANLRQLDPLEGNAYEIGLKSAFFDEKLQTSIALFRIEQDNLAQVDLTAPPITPPGGLPQQPSIAIDGTRSEGFEFELNGSPLENWNLNFGYSQFKAKDSDGDAVSVNQPRKLLKLFTTYTFPDILSGFTFGGGVNYRSKAYSAGLNTVTGAPFNFQQDGYALVSLMARLAVNEQLSVQANLENLTDKTYFAQIGFYDQYRYGPPRNVTISANYRF